MILANAARCLKCGDEIYSGSVHDYSGCGCGEIFVDGGQEYFRAGYKNRENFMDLSIEIDDLTFQMCMSSLDWCDENGRNNLGRVCAMFRALRDVGYINEKSIGSEV